MNTSAFNLGVIVIGLGKQSIEDHLPAVDSINGLRLLGVVDVDIAQASKVGSEYDTQFADSVEELLKRIEKPDMAIVAVPHNCYMPIIEILAQRGIHIVKEKPFAIDSGEAKKMCALAKENNISIQVTLQRRFNPIFSSYLQLMKRIGAIYSIEARYTMNVKDLQVGWRARKSEAGGGALIDMGYHYIDLFIWYFGLPEKVRCKISTGNREGQDYDVEDTAFLDFTYVIDGVEANANLLVSRVYPEKDEGLTAYGRHGSVSVSRGILVRRDNEGNVIEQLERKVGWPSAIIDQLEVFCINIAQGTAHGINERYYEHTAVLEAAYESARLSKELTLQKFIDKCKE